jgi:hypothetical protein
MAAPDLPGASFERIGHRLLCRPTLINLLVKPSTEFAILLKRLDSSTLDGQETGASP